MNVRLLASALSLLLAASLVPAAGCIDPDPEGALDQFRERTEDLRGADEDVGGEGCVRGNFGHEFAGTYFFNLGVTQLTQTPYFFLVEVSTDDGENYTLDFQPLKTDLTPAQDPREDARSPVGPPVTAITNIDESGEFLFRMDAVSISGEANPFSFSDIFAEFFEAEAFTCGRFAFCGEMDEGLVTSPVRLNLAGATFGAVRLDYVAEGDTEPLGIFGLPRIRSCADVEALIGIPDDSGDEE